MTSSLTDKLFDNKMMAVSQNWIDWQFILVLFNAVPPQKRNQNKKSWGKKKTNLDCRGPSLRSFKSVLDES